MAAGDANGYPDLIIRDRIANATELISVGATFGIWEPADIQYAGKMSADGRFVVFTSLAGGLIPGMAAPMANNLVQVYVRDRLLAQTRLVSVDGAGEPINGTAIGPAFSDDGRYVAFLSDAPNIAGGENPPRTYDVDLMTGA